MHIIINHSSMIPLYEQITDRIKAAIRDGRWQKNDCLPSVRALAKELRISVLTVKKAYDLLEEDGFVITVQGKGTYVAEVDPARLREEQIKDLEADLKKAIQKGRMCGIPDEDIRHLFHLLWED